jgi:hypothetical protein
LADVDLRQLAKKVRAQGRGRDTVLAHITPAEAKLLKARGGRGSINPKTGLPEFEDDDFGGFDFGGDGNQQIYDSGADLAPQNYSGDGGPDEAPAPAQPEFGPGSEFQQNIYPDGGQVPQAYDAQGFPLIDASQVPDPSTPEATAAREPGFLERLTSGLGLGGLGNIGGADLARLGLAGAGVGLGVQARNAALAAARNAQTDIRGVGDTAKRRADDVRTDLGNVSVNIASRADPAKADFQALAEPYQKQGKELIQAALSGTLSPSSAQTYQAAEARMNQAQSRSGGVGAAQGVAQLETLRQSLLSNQYQEGLKVQQYGDQLARQGITTGLAQANLGSAAEADAIKSALAAAGISDTYTLRAIQAGLEGNREASRLSAGYFQALGSLLGGTPALRAQPAATTTPGA